MIKQINKYIINHNLFTKAISYFTSRSTVLKTRFHHDDYSFDNDTKSIRFFIMIDLTILLSPRTSVYCAQRHIHVCIFSFN